MIIVGNARGGCRHSRYSPRLLHDAGDRCDDSDGTAAQEYIDGRRCGDVEHPGQRYQHSLRPRNSVITGFDLFILAMFGCFQVALGLTLFFLGSRLLPSGQAP